MKKKILLLSLCVFFLVGCGTNTPVSETNPQVSGNETVSGNTEILISETLPEDYETLITLTGNSPVYFYTKDDYVIYTYADYYNIVSGNNVTDTAVNFCKAIAEDSEVKQDVILDIDVQMGPSGTEEIVEQTYSELFQALSDYLITKEVYGISLQTNETGQVALDKVAEQVKETYSEELQKRVNNEFASPSLNREPLDVESINANIDLENLDHEHEMKLVASDTTMISPCQYKKWADYQCNICGYTEEKIYDTFTSHDVIAIEDDVFPTCTEDGYRGAKSCACGEITEPREVIPAYGHQYEEEVDNIETETITNDDGTTSQHLTQHWILKCRVCGDIAKAWDISF